MLPYVILLVELIIGHYVYIRQASCMCVCVCVCSRFVLSFCFAQAPNIAQDTTWPIDLRPGSSAFIMLFEMKIIIKQSFNLYVSPTHLLGRPWQAHGAFLQLATFTSPSPFSSVSGAGMEGIELRETVGCSDYDIPHCCYFINIWKADRFKYGSWNDLKNKSNGTKRQCRREGEGCDVVRVKGVMYMVCWYKLVVRVEGVMWVVCTVPVMPPVPVLGLCLHVVSISQCAHRHLYHVASWLYECYVHVWTLGAKGGIVKQTN